MISVKRACLPIRNLIGATSSLDQPKHEALDNGSRSWRAIHVVNSHLEGFTNAQHAHHVDIREDAYRHQHVNGLCRATGRQRFRQGALLWRHVDEILRIVDGLRDNQDPGRLIGEFPKLQCVTRTGS